MTTAFIIRPLGGTFQVTLTTPPPPTYSYVICRRAGGTVSNGTIAGITKDYSPRIDVLRGLA